MPDAKQMVRASRSSFKSGISSIFVRRLVWVFLTCLILLALLNIGTPAGQAQSSSAYDLIAAVNQLRANNGLPAYQINSALMSAAQAHSDYQASTGSITHTGAGGTSAKDRAVAAGYGGGAAVFVSENIAGGSSFSVQSVVQMWQGDSLHLNTMLGGSYQDVGAGVATSGGSTYYTLDVGYIAGESSGASNSDAPSSSGALGAESTPAAAFFPVIISTPNPDGSILHIVQPGQSLWSIAATYKVDLPVLLELNGLSNNGLIFPGDELVIKPPDDQPESIAIDMVEQPMKNITQKPDATPTSGGTPTQSIPAHESLTSVPAASTPTGSTPAETDPILLVIGFLVFGGTAMMIVGLLLKRP